MRALALLLASSLLAFAQDAPVEGRSPHRALELDGAAGDLRKLVAGFEIRDRDFPWTLTRKREKDRHVEYELTFPSPVVSDIAENNTVPCKVWVPKDDRKRRPAAVLLHWLGGSFELLEVVGARLADRGVTTLMLWMPHYGKRRAADREKRIRMISLDNEKTVANFRQSVLDVRRAGDWLAARPDVDPERVGLMGVSLGAIVGSVVAGVDTNFRRTCLLVGGGDLPLVVMNGSRETDEIRKKAEELGITREKLTELWRGIEPLTYAPRVQGSSVLMINAEHDQVFPRESTEKLWEAYGRPEIVWYKADHFTWALQMTKVVDRCEAHLKGRDTYVRLREPLLAPPAIRVLIRENAQSLALDIDGSCDVRRPGGAAPLERDVKVGRATASSSAGRVTVGERRWDEPWVVLEPRGTFKVGDRTYEGALHLVAARAGGLHAVVEVDLERYVAGVLGGEMSTSSPIEALKAQAVCARSYAYNTWRETARSAQRAIFDVYDDTRDQVYKGVPERGGSCEKATEATAGRVIWWEDKPVKAFFSSTCGGTPESGAEVFATDLPPLAGGKCGSCGHAKHYRWRFRMSEAEMSTALNASAGGAVRDVTIASRTRTGRVARVTLKRADGVEVLLAGTELRKTLGYDKFRSTKFEVAREDGALVFSGEGWGHGVGMCQEGAIGLAQSGTAWDAIIARYYPGGTVKAAY